jgi:hypothetical protein
MTDTELYDALSEFRKPIRMAILFTLAFKISPRAITGLTWTQVREFRLNKRAMAVLNLIARHISSDLVFWQTRNGKPEPLTGFIESLDRLLGIITLEEFREMYDEMLYIDELSKEFIRLMFLNANAKA